MLRILSDLTPYMDFIHEVNGDPCFGDPILSSQEEIRCNLLDAPGRPDRQVWSILVDGQITGLFVFLILEKEAYIEMLVGLSRDKAAYQEALSALKERYPGYQADFVYNPANYLLHGLLENMGAEFDTEQQKMVLKQEIPYESGRQVELYSPRYREQYLAIHRNIGYWTGEKVIETPDKFRILLAVEAGQVVGYLDITHKYEENEPFDLFVQATHRRRGYGRAMLARAIVLNRPKGMMLTVDVDNTAAIALYRSLGFVKAEGQNNITANVPL